MIDQKNFSAFTSAYIFPSGDGNIIKQRILAAVAREAQQEHPRNRQSRNRSVPRVDKDYITEVSDENGGRVTEKLSLEISSTKSRIFGAFSKLDEFLLNPQVWIESRTLPGISRTPDVENQETNEDRFQNDPCPEVGSSSIGFSKDSDPGDGFYNHSFLNYKGRVF